MSAALDAVVLVQVGGAVCAGAALDDEGLVLTAYHCVAAGGPVVVYTRGGGGTVARIESTDTPADLALLRAEGLQVEATLEVAETSPELGATVRALGHPYGDGPSAGFLSGLLRWSVSEGTVANAGPMALQITAPVNPGNSGGPVLDEAGRIVGVVSRRIDGDGLGFVTRAEVVSEFLADRPEPALGGTVDVRLGGVFYGASFAFAIGFDVEATVRDRFFVGGSARMPFQTRWSALDFGQALVVPIEGRIGVRQRLGRGDGTVYLDVLGGVGLGQRWIPQEDLRFRVLAEPVLFVGGRIGLGGVWIDGGAAWTPSGWEPRIGATVGLPGTVSVF